MSSHLWEGGGREKIQLLPWSRLNFPLYERHKIGRIYRNPDYKYEIIIPDNSSPSPSSRGRSSQPTKRDYLTKSNRNEFLFLSIPLSLSLSLPTDLIPNRLLKSLVQSRPPIPLLLLLLHFRDGTNIFPLSFSFSFNSHRISLFPLYLTTSDRSSSLHRVPRVRVIVVNPISMTSRLPPPRARIVCVILYTLRFYSLFWRCGNKRRKVTACKLENVTQ